MRIALLLLLFATPARAQTEGDPRLAGCEGIPVQRAKVESLGEDAVHVVARSGARWLVFSDGDGCRVYPIGRAAARATGRFGAAGKAFVLQPQCQDDACVVALAVRGAGERPLLALETQERCDVDVELRAVPLFPDRDGIEMVCRSSSGAGWHEHWVLFDVANDSLVTLYSLDAGGYEAPTQEERRAGQKGICPVGWFRVEKVGPVPLLRVLDPATGTMNNSKGTIPARQLRYDAKQHTFVPSGAPDVPTKVDGWACRFGRRR